jgi:DNA-binding beta-propeller fold protein YncE
MNVRYSVVLFGAVFALAIGCASNSNSGQTQASAAPTATSPMAAPQGANGDLVLFVGLTQSTTATLDTYGINPTTGGASVESSVSLNKSKAASAMAIMASGSYVYDIDVAGNLNSFEVGANSQLISVGTPEPVGSSPTGITTAGSYVYVTNSSNNTIYSFNTNANGVPTPGPTTTLNSPSLVRADPAGTHIYVVNGYSGLHHGIPHKGKTMGGRYFVGSGNVLGYTIGANGALTANGTGVSTGNGPFGLAVDSTGNFVYVTNTADGTISGYSSSNGSLTSLGAATSTGVNPGPIATDPKAGFSYVVCNSGIYAYKVETTGSLSLIQTIQFAKETVAPGTSAAVDPTGGYFYRTDALGSLYVYTIGSTGKLTQLGSAIALGGPPVFIVPGAAQSEAMGHNASARPHKPHHSSAG